MNRINAITLMPGQVFSAPVYSEGKNLLVPAMVPLRKRDIDLLSALNIDFVTTEGKVIAIEEVEEAEAEAEAEEVLEEQLEEDTSQSNKKGPVKFSIGDVELNSGQYRSYKNFIEKLDAIFSAISSGEDVDMRSIDKVCARLLQDVRDNPDSFIDYILGGEVAGRELAKSSVNTAILSALTAQELQQPNHKILNIVAGALLHDVGMLRLSRGITEKKGGLSDAELEQIKSHPLHSSKIVSRELFGPHEVNLIALQHHERWDGKGYPDHIIGPAIDLGARIVSVADAFEAMVSKKSYRNSMLGYQAVKNLLADNARRFDPAVIMAFTKIMGIYPIGSIVRLNDGSVARVVNVHGDVPLRPVVKMLIDKDGKVLSPREGVDIDLLAEKRLFIKNAIDPEEFNAQNA